ncbi:MAG: S9 family peptidase [Opitutae bacterium]|nr:S9 family peptidase [Opitutae bacterium]
MPTRLARRCSAAVLVVTLAVRLLAADPAPPSPAATVPRPEEIPVEAFFRPPAIRSPQLNPAGTHLAVLTHDLKHDANSLAILDIAGGPPTGVRGTTDLNISSFSWTDDDRLVFSIVKDNHYAFGLYVADRKDPYRVKTLNSRDAVEVLGKPRQRPDNILLWIHRSASNNGRDEGVVEVDLRRSQRSPGDAMNVHHSIPIPKFVSGVQRWLRDRDGEIRYAIAHSDGRLICIRRDAKENWSPVSIDLEIDSPLAVDADPNVLFVAHRNATGASDLVRFNTVDGTRGPALHSDEKYDFRDGRVRYSAAEKDIVGLSYARQATQQVWLRAEDAALQRDIDASLPPGGLNSIVSRDREGSRMLIVSYSDRHPGTLYLFDRQKRQLKELTSLAPWLPEKLLAPVRLVTFPTRDGLKLDGYVTVPLNYVEGRPSPMIVLPHGGPWHRDVWGYDPQSQFFASRGYIVFRPNYRGSSGYNAAISRTPMFDFRRMHDDVTDGVRALVDAKVADPAHLAIIGSSFGGYLAVCGAAFEPDLYKCAVTIAGVFDWKRMQSEDRDNDNEFRAAWLRRNIGDPKQQAEKFEALSPFYSVNQIKIPVFVAHGTEDNNADTSQSRRLVKALKTNGVEHEALFIPYESHGFVELKHRIELFTRIEAFLKKHL